MKQSGVHRKPAHVATIAIVFSISMVFASGLSVQLNIVLIMTDDLDLGSFNVALNQGWMPNLHSQLLNQGTMFSNSFVTNSLCCPSRSSSFTGQYPHNTGVLTNNNRSRGGVTRLDDTSTVATWLNAEGYRTGYIGKYLNGYGADLVDDDPADDPTYIPPGWDDWQGLVDPSTYKMYDYTMNDNGTLLTFGSDPSDYQTDVPGSASRCIHPTAWF